MRIQPSPTTTPVRGHARVALAAAAGYIAVGTVLQIMPPFADAIQGGFTLASSPAGLGMAAFLLPMAVLSFPAGRACDRRGPRAVSRVGYILLGLATLGMAAAPTVEAFLLGRAIGGLGASLVIVAALKLIGAGVPAARLGVTLGVFVAGLPVGTILAFDVITPLVGHQHWRGAFLLATGVVVACYLGYEVAGRTAGASIPAASGPSRMRISGSLALLLALAVVGYAIILAFTTWVPVHVPRYALLAPQTTVILASILLAIDIPAGPAWGHLSDRLGRRKPFLIYAFVVYGAGAVALPFVASAPGPRVLWLSLLIAVMGAGCAMFLPASLAVLPQFVPVEQLGRGYGLFITAQVTGMALGPLALGPAFEYGLPTGLITIAAISAVGVLLAAAIRAR